MEYKRILTVQDVSCVGKCSMSIALPILTACGHEVCILPTAVLSTHTGCPSRPCVQHMDAFLLGVFDHWTREGVQFDLILTGYLGSVQAVDSVLKICDQMLAPGGELIVDPAMADHGKLYSGLDAALGFSQEEVYLEDIIDKKSGEVVELAKRKVVKKTIPPDVRALLFWLKNRYPDSWRDRVDMTDDSDDYDFDSDELKL